MTKCFCPFAKEHCTSGRVESHPNDECEFWNQMMNDCRIRRVLELLETNLALLKLSELVSRWDEKMESGQEKN